MPSEHGITPYRRLYAFLLRLYPRQYRERFGEGMDQTFADLCRERTTAGKSLFPFALWMFGDTVAGILSVRIAYFFSHLVMHAKHVLRPALVTLLLLVIPLLGNRYVEGWDWSVFDFAFMGCLIFGIGFAYELLAKKGGSAAYRAAAGLGLAGMFFLVWVTAAVGIIGEDNPGNILYGMVLITVFFGSILARFRPRGMAYVLCAAAAVQLAVPVVAAVFWPADFAPGILPVFVLNCGFVALFAGSAVLFKQAGEGRSSAAA